MSSLRVALGDTGFQAAWQEGERLSHEDVLCLAENLAAELSRPTAEETASARDDHQLTARELEVLALVAHGHPDRRIAKLLNISPVTASKHVSHMLGKLNLRNRTEPARWATEHQVGTSIQ